MKDETIEPLPEEVTIGRVIDEENTKTFKFSGVVLKLDNSAPGEDYTDAEVDFENPVKVYNSDGEPIGCVTLAVEGRAVVGEFFLNYHCPERLNIETKMVPMYALPTTIENVSASGDGEKVHYCWINEIELTSDRPHDPLDPL